MEQSRSNRLRRLWLNVHLWLGVGLLVAFIPLGISGSLLVWHEPLERVIHAERFAITGTRVVLPPAAYAANARAAFGTEAHLTQIRFPQEAGDPVVAVGRMDGPPGPGGRPRTLNVWLDPATAKVLDKAEVAKGVFMVLHRLHGSLLIPEVGRKVVGWLGWAMFVSSATGLWLWWPRNGALLKALRWRRGPSTLFNLHHMVGFWICLPLAVLSLTGVYISFPQTSRALFGVTPPPEASSPNRSRFAPPTPQPRLCVEAVTAQALAAHPGASLAVVNVPVRGDAPAWKVQVQSPGRSEPTALAITDATGEMALDKAGPGGRGKPDPLSRWMRRIHDGAEMGLVWQTIIFLGGLAPTLLSITGVIMWLRGRARKRAVI